MKKVIKLVLISAILIFTSRLAMTEENIAFVSADYLFQNHPERKAIAAKLETEFKEYKSRSDLMTVFWNEKDQRWCEECDDYVQQYRSIILLEDEKVIPKSKYRPGYAKQNGLEKHRSCRIK